MASRSDDLSQMGSICIKDIADKAHQLLQLCAEFLKEEQNTGCLAAAQLSRFNLWASNIGVFSKQQSYLDYRLRTAPITLKVAIDGSLEIICMHTYSVLVGHDELEDDVLDEFASMTISDVSKHAISLQKSSLPSTTARKTALTSIQNTINTLQQLSLAIRKASNRNTLTKAPKLIFTDNGYKIERTNPTDCSTEIVVEPESFDGTVAFERYINEVLKRRWFINPEAISFEPQQENYRVIMRKRCAAAISMRRRQLMYFQSHHTKLSTPWIPRSATAAAQSVEKTGPMFSRHIDTKLCSPDHPGGANLSVPALETTSRELKCAAPSDTVPSEFQLSQFRPAPPTAAPSSTKSSSKQGIGWTGPFELPPPPEVATDDQEKMCPYCCLVFPARLFSTHRNSRRWRKHLVEDIQPYPCLFERCDQPNRTYPIFTEWKNHLNQQHISQWVCPLPHPQSDLDLAEFSYGSKEGFEEHLRYNHKDHIPFGGGIWACPGRYFVKQQALLTLAVLVTMFDFEIPAEKDIEVSTGRFPFGVLEPKKAVSFSIRTRA